jgi:hypothetical protein
MPSASGRSPPRKTSSRSGKTPIPISPSEGSQGRVCEVTVKSSSFLDLRLKQRFFDFLSRLLAGKREVLLRGREQRCLSPAG